MAEAVHSGLLVFSTEIVLRCTFLWREAQRGSRLSSVFTGPSMGTAMKTSSCAAHSHGRPQGHVSRSPQPLLVVSKSFPSFHHFSSSPCYLAQVALNLSFSCLRSPKCWDHRCAPSHSAYCNQTCHLPFGLARWFAGKGTCH